MALQRNWFGTESPYNNKQLIFCGYHATYVTIQRKFRTSLEPSLVGQPLHYLEPSWAMKIATYSVTDVYAIFP